MTRPYAADDFEEIRKNMKNLGIIKENFIEDDFDGISLEGEVDVLWYLGDYFHKYKPLTKRAIDYFYNFCAGPPINPPFYRFRMSVKELRDHPSSPCPKDFIFQEIPRP